MISTDNHRAVSRQFIRQADEELERGDYLQASEKAWGAATRALKNIAIQRGWDHTRHKHLYRTVTFLLEETQDEDIRRFFNSAEQLHANFYEGWMDEVMVTKNIQDVKLLLDKLESFTQRIPTA